MVERISTKSRYDQLVADMKINQFNFDKLTAQLSSGNKITSITDDPIASVNILNTNRQLGRIDTYTQNVNMGQSELSALDDFMELARGYLQTAWDKGVQANNQVYGKDALTALKTEIDEIKKTLVDLGNSEYNDNYIFAGANTKLTPFEILDNGDIVYHGTPASNPDYIRQVEIADGVFETINTTGDKVFGYYKAAVEAGNGVYTDADGKRVIAKDEGGTTVYRYEDGKEYTGALTDLTDGAKEEAEGVMGALCTLSNAIQMVLDGDEVNGYDKMNKSLDMFASSHNKILNEQTKFGGVYNRMEMSNSTLETTGENLTTYLADINSVDYAEAISQWINAQYAYQASMKVASSSMGMSLLNYL